MSRDGSGNFNLPESPFVFDTVISETAVNHNFSDIATALSASIANDGQTPTTARIPFASGISTDTIAEQTSGSGVTIDSVLLKDGAVDTAQGSDIASASSIDLGAATGNYVKVTGTTAITALGAATAGRWRIVEFTGALTLTHNATSLILPGAANITTAAGDCALFVSEGSGNWRCAVYQRADGTPISITDNSVPNSGLAQVPANTLKGNNTGSTADVADLTVSQVKAMLSGMPVQTISVVIGTVATGTTEMPFDDTIPQNTEGDQYMSLSITPTNASSTLEIAGIAYVATNATSAQMTLGIFQDGATDAKAAAAVLATVATGMTAIPFRFTQAAGGTTSTTFKVRIGANVSGTTTFNGESGFRRFGGAMASSMRITEYLP